jgi:hypothetical protein
MRLGLLRAIFYPIYSAEEKKHNGNQCCELQALEKDVRVTVSSSTPSAPDKKYQKTYPRDVIRDMVCPRPSLTSCYDTLARKQNPLNKRDKSA